VASRVPGKWCRGPKPPAVVGTLDAVDVGLDDALAIVAKMHERTDMPVMSIRKRNGLVRALVQCCPTRDDCGTLIVEFGKQNGSGPLSTSASYPASEPAGPRDLGRPGRQPAPVRLAAEEVIQDPGPARFAAGERLRGGGFPGAQSRWGPPARDRVSLPCGHYQ
jgi:hypothetical protein